MTTRKLLPDLLPSTQYAIQVRAVTPEGVSEWSQRKVFTTIADTILPLAPTNATWAAVGNSFHGEWTASTLNENGDAIAINRYEIELVAGGVTKIDSVVPATGTSKVTYDLPLAANVALFGSPKASITFRVRAVDNKELKSNWSAPTLTATNAAPAAPTAPSVGSVATAGTDVISLAWSAPSDDDVIGYNVYVGATAGFTPSASNRIYSGNSTRFAFTTTTYTTQYFKIRSVDAFGQESSDLTANASANSSFNSDTTAPAVPSITSATLTNTSNDAGAQATLVWSITPVATDLAGFTVQYRKTGTTNWAQTTTDKDARTVVINLDSAYSNYDFQVRSFDWQSNFSAFSAITVGTGQNNSAPGTPTAPSVAASVMQIQVTLDGNKIGGVAMDADVVYYEIYASTTTNFTPSNTNMIGTIPVGPALVNTFDVPAAAATGTAQTWYVKAIAVDRGGLKGPASAQSSKSVPLIDATNIGDAVITNAKIGSLDADKITAGNGFINNVIVKSKFTLGDASTVGAIESFGYVAGTSGFRFDKNLLEINQGSISAAALNIQNSSNLLPVQYADFEFAPAFYSLLTTAATTSIITSQNYINTASLQINTTNATNSVTLGSTATDWNFMVSPSTTYIVSWYVRNPGVASTVTPTIKALTTTATVNGADFSGTPTVMASSTNWARYSTVITTGATVTGKALLYFKNFTNATNLSIDAVQVEEKIGGLNTPSTWKPPSTTRIDGGMIRTGAIRSTATAQVWDDNLNAYKNDPDGQPAWAIDLSGSAQFGSLIVKGNVVVGNQANVNLVDKTKLSTVASATYIPGAQGWILRADGSSEFRSMAIGSLDGSAIKANSLSVDALKSGTIDATIVLSGSFQTASDPTAVLLTTTLNSTTVSTSVDDPVFSSSDVGIYIAAPGLSPETRIVSITSDHVAVISKPAYATGAGVDGSLYRGRIATVSGVDGIILTDQYGEDIIRMPTNPDEPNYFKGSILATDLTVSNNFRMNGQNNSLGQGSQLYLEGGTYRPSSYPSVVSTYDVGYLTQYGPNSSVRYNMYDDPYINDENGLIYDSAQNVYYFVNTFYGAQVFSIRGPSSVAGEEGKMITSINLSDALYGGSSDRTFGGLAADASNFHFLTKNITTGEWRHQAISRTAMTSGTSPALSDRTSNHLWADALSGGLNGYPGIATFGGNMYTAKLNSANQIVLYKYTGNSMAVAPAIAKNTGIVASGNVQSVNVGQFDFGTGVTYVVVSMAGITSNHRQNFVFAETATTFNTTLWSFSTPYDKTALLGTAYVGTSTNDATGYFKTMTRDGYMYNFTKLGATSSYNTVTVTQRWRNDGSGGGTVAIGPEGPIGTGSYKRRSKITITSRTSIPNVGGNSPNAVTFYLGLGVNTRFRYDEQPAGVMNTIVSQFRVSDAPGTTTIMADGIPSKLLSSAGLEINGDGQILSNNAILRLKASAAQAIPDGVWTLLTMVSDSSRGVINASASTALIGQKGWYSCSGLVTFVSNTVGRRVVRIEKVTSALEAPGAGPFVARAEGTGAYTTGATTPGVNATGLVYCDIGDKIRMVCYQTSGSSLSTTSTDGAWLQVNIVP